MTSDKAGRSNARTQLDYALGEARVSLGALSPEEFDEFLRKAIDELDLRELRGFKTLKAVLCHGREGISSVKFTEATRVVPNYIESAVYTPNIQVVDLSRGVLAQVTTWRRHESGEETTEWEVANGWGRDGGFVSRIHEAILVLRRPNDHTRPSENLFKVWYQLDKVPFKPEMTVGMVEVVPIPLAEFRLVLGKKYSSAACDLVRQLDMLASQTLEDLESKARMFRQHSAHMSQLAHSIME